MRHLMKDTKDTYAKAKNMEIAFSPTLSFIQHFQHVDGLGNSCVDLSKTKGD